MTEMLNPPAGGQHDVLRLSAAFVKTVTLNLFQGLIINLSFAGGTTEKSVPIVRDFSSFFVSQRDRFARNDNKA